MHGVTHGLAAFAIRSANPKAAIVLGVVQTIAGGLQQIGQVVHADTPQHLAGSTVGRNPDHAGKGVAGIRVELHVAGFDAGEGPEQNGDLGQARGIDHVVGIQSGEAGVFQIGDVG